MKKHLTISQARKELTVLNAMKRAGVVNTETTLPADKALAEGFEKIERVERVIKDMGI